MKHILITVLTFAILSACSAPSQLKNTQIIDEDLSGKLSQDKLDSIAKLIRELEQNPFDTKAQDAKLVLFKWLVGSPDVNVSIYPIISNAKSLDEKSQGFLTTQLMFSTAGAIIEEPALKNDNVSATATGLQRTLAVYEILKKKNAVSDPYLNTLIDEQKNGNLENIISEIVNESDKKQKIKLK